jgi:hypothetical protein
MRLFQPSPRETNALIALGAAALGYALYVRMLVIDAQPVEAACAQGLARAVCILRKVTVELQELKLFGGVALVAAVVHLYRPRLAVFAVGLLAAIFGLVLYNNALAALAVALLIMSFARPVSLPSDKSMPERSARPRTTAPASSRKFH